MQGTLEIILRPAAAGSAREFAASKLAHASAPRATHSLRRGGGGRGSRESLGLVTVELGETRRGAGC